MEFYFQDTSPTDNNTHVYNKKFLKEFIQKTGSLPNSDPALKENADK